MNRTLAVVIAIVAAVGGGAALYGKMAGNGNIAGNGAGKDAGAGANGGGAQMAAATCGRTKEQAVRLADLATGDLAAFILAQKPVNLSTLAFRDEDNAPMTLARFSGKVTLVNLWATWCAPCRREMPALDRLQQALGGEQFDVVTINIDTGDFERPEAFLQSVNVTALPRYRDPDNTSFQELKRRGLALGLPSTVLVAGDGCLIGHLQGPAEWDSDDARRLIEAVLVDPSA